MSQFISSLQGSFSLWINYSWVHIIFIGKVFEIISSLMCHCISRFQCSLEFIIQFISGLQSSFSLWINYSWLTKQLFTLDKLFMAYKAVFHSGLIIHESDLFIGKISEIMSLHEQYTRQLKIMSLPEHFTMQPFKIQ